MSSSEDYLDQLLKSLDDAEKGTDSQTDQKGDSTESLVSEPISAEPEKSKNLQEDSNKMMTPEDIERLLSQTSEEPVISGNEEFIDLNTVSEMEEPAEPIEIPMVEEPEESIEIPMVEEPAESIEIPMVEEPEESIEMPMVEEPSESIEMPMVEEPAESIEIPMVEDDSNKMMTPEDIEKLLAQTAEEPMESETEEALEALELPESEEIEGIEELEEKEEAEQREEPEEMEALDAGTPLEDDANKVMTPEEIANLLAAIPELESGEGEVADVSSGLADDTDVTDLLDLVPEDVELSEINDLLKKNDNNEMVEDDMLQMLANADTSESGGTEEEPIDFFSESQQEESENQSSTKKPKKEKKKRVKKSRKDKKPEEEETTESEDDVVTKKEKKSGFFGKLINQLFEEEEEEQTKKKEEPVPEETLFDEPEKPVDENKQILKEMEEEDQEEGEKKGKKGKKEKRQKKAKKSKEEKQREKEERAAAAAKEPVKKIPAKKMIPIFAINGSILVLILIGLHFIPGYLATSKADSYYQKGDYESAYWTLSGLKLKGNDQKLYAKTMLLMKMKRFGDSYENFHASGDELRALDMLIQGIKMHDSLQSVSTDLEVTDTFEELFNQLTKNLDNYDLSLDEARGFGAIESKEEYSIALEDFLFGPTEVEIDPSELETAPSEGEDSEDAIPEEDLIIKDEEDVSASETEGETEDARMGVLFDSADGNNENAAGLDDTTTSTDDGLNHDNQDNNNQNDNIQEDDKVIYQFGVKKGNDGTYRAE